MLRTVLVEEKRRKIVKAGKSHTLLNTKYICTLVDSLLLYFLIIFYTIDFDYTLISYSILCLHIICVIHVTHIKLYSQTVSFSSRSHTP